jgi:hypothetical protein
VRGSTFEQAIEGGGFPGGEEGGGGVLAGVRIGTGAGGIEIPVLVGLFPERDLHFAIFAFEILYAGCENSASVFQGTPSELAHAALLGERVPIVQDKIVKARLPLIAE